MPRYDTKNLLVLAALLAVFGAPGCDDGDDSAPPRSAIVYVADASPDALLGAAEDLGGYLSIMLDSEVNVITVGLALTLDEAIRTRHEAVLLIGNFNAARAVLERGDAGLEALGPQGFALRRIEAGGKVVVAAAGGGLLGDQYAVYDLATRLGVRFLHPEEEWVPVLGCLPVPPGLDVEMRPGFSRRGFHLNLTRPVELLEAFLRDEPGTLQRAHRYVDWLVKTKQSWLQWWLLVSVPFPEMLARASGIAEYAHGRGLGVGAMVSFARLQENVLRLVNPTVPEDDVEEIEELLGLLMEVEWDAIVATLGRHDFTSTDDIQAVVWMNAAAGYLDDNFGIPFFVVSHVPAGLDAPLYEVSYYHLPEVANRAVGAFVASVMAYSLDGVAPVYGNEDFGFQLDFIARNLGVRPLVYHPETSAWSSFDIDVPLLLPAYIESRARDIATLAPHAAAGEIEGHVTSTSGLEWGYWLHDYVVAELTWNPQRAWEEVVAEAMSPAGDSAGVLSDVVIELAREQRLTLLEGGGIAFLAGEDPLDALNQLLGIETHPMAPPFATLVGRNSAELDGFEATVVGALDRTAGDMLVFEVRLADVLVTASADGAWLVREFLDGVQLLRLRAEHLALLYRAVLAARRAELTADGVEADRLAMEAQDLLADARAVTAEARGIVRDHEELYRYPLALSVDVEPADPPANATVHSTRYLTRPHDVYLWERRDDAAAAVIAGAYSPVALRVSPVQLFLAETATVDATDFAGGPGTTFTFDFDDGAPVTAGPLANVEHTYNAVGQFTLIATVAGLQGGLLTLSENVAVVLAALDVENVEVMQPADPDGRDLVASLLPPLRLGITELASGSFSLALSTDVDGNGVSDPGSVVFLPAGAVVPSGDFTAGGGVAVLDAAAAGAAGLEVRLLELGVFGVLDEVTTPERIDPGTLFGSLVVADLVAVVTASEDRTAADALARVAAAFGFDPATPPDTVETVIDFTAAAD